MTVRVVVDMLFYTGKRGGTETYTREIVRRLPQFLPDAHLTALVGRVGADRVRSFFPGDVDVVGWVGADRGSWAAGELLFVNRRARRARADVVWSPANFGPITSAGVARVTTTHDVTYHTAKGSLSTRALARSTSWLVSRAALTSDAVITGSHAAEADLITHMGLDPRAISVIPHGTTAPQTTEEPWKELAALGIPRDRPLVLSTGNRLPHKNFEGLLRAVATMESDRPLIVIPGSHGKDPLAPIVDELGLLGDVVLPGWVTSAQLEALFSAASLYVCPSLTEGFGLPVIEAMRRGCIVVSNDVPVLREVGGAEALYVDASSPTALAAAIRAALSADQEPRREAGIRRGAAYTWERSAERTARILVEAATHIHERA